MSSSKGDLDRSTWTSSRGLRGVGLVILFVVATLAVLRPTPHELSRTLPNDLGDPALVTALLSWGAHALVTDPTEVLNAPFFWDHPNALTFSDPLLPLAPLHGALSAATGNEVLAVNLLAVGLVVVNLGATFLLARRVVGGADAALVASFASGFNAFTLSQQSHIQLQTVGFLPLGFLALFVLFERERPIHGLWLGMASTVITLNALYYGVLWSVVLGLVVIIEVIRRRGRLSAGLWAGLAVAGASMAVVLAPLGLIYSSTRAEHGGERGFELDNVLLLGDLLTPASGNWLWGTSLDGVNSAGEPGPHAFFLGMTVYLLVLVGLVTAGRHAVRRARDGQLDSGPAAGGRPVPNGHQSAGRSPVRWLELGHLTAAGVLSAALAVGPSPGGRPGLFRLFYHHVPGFDGIRVTSRLVVVAILACAVLAALGYRVLVERLPDTVGLRVAALVVVGGLVLAEAYPAEDPPRVEVPDTPARTAVYDELARRAPGPVLELPMADPGQGVVWPYTEAPRMLLATVDRNPRVNGYSGFFPDTYLGDVTVLNRVPEPEAMRRLEDLGVRYLVLHLGEEQGWPALSGSDVRAILRGLPPDTVSGRFGDAWLVDLGDQLS